MTTLKNTLKPYLHFDGMTWPDPRYVNELEWRVRHAEKSVTRNDALVMASVLAAYHELVTLPVRDRNKRVAKIRKAMENSSSTRMLKNTSNTEK